MTPGYRIEGDVIYLDRELNELDFFVRDFLSVLFKYTPYLIVSGYVSISTGRTRGTEDVDVLIPRLNKDAFRALFEDLTTQSFWCYQANDSSEAFEYHKELLSIRFARVNQMFPNMEVIPITPARKAKFFEFSNPQKMNISGFEFLIPPIEFEITYKELLLKSAKDLADAKHLRDFFKDILSKKKFRECEKVIRENL